VYNCFIAEPAICERAAHLENIQTARLALDSDQIKGNGSCRKCCHHFSMQYHQNRLAAVTLCGLMLPSDTHSVVKCKKCKKKCIVCVTVGHIHAVFSYALNRFLLSSRLFIY